MTVTEAARSLREFADDLERAGEQERARMPGLRQASNSPKFTGERAVGAAQMLGVLWNWATLLGSAYPMMLMPVPTILEFIRSFGRDDKLFAVGTGTVFLGYEEGGVAAEGTTTAGTADVVAEAASSEGVLVRKTGEPTEEDWAAFEEYLKKEGWA